MLLMEDLLIPATRKTPEIHFSAEGELVMTGRSLPEDVDTFYEPLIAWIQELTAEDIKFKIFLDYFNSASSKRLIDMFKHLEANHNVKNIQITWMYEEGDEDSLETAQIFEDSLMRTVFRYIEQTELE